MSRVCHAGHQHAPGGGHLWPCDQEGDGIKDIDACPLRGASGDCQRVLRTLARRVQTEARGPVKVSMTHAEGTVDSPVESRAHHRRDEVSDKPG